MSAARRCPGCRARTSSTSAWRPTRTRSRSITDTLLSLGFQRQSGLAPFPPTRPLMVGNVDHDGTSFRVHLHVMPPARHELAELLAFRDALRADPALRDGYARSKQEFVEAAPDGDANLLYTIHKGDFVLQEPCTGSASARVRPTRPSPLAARARRSGSWAAGSSGRMLGIAARALGYRMVALDPDPDCPAASVADRIVVGAYDDVDAARRLAAMADVVTYELEHVGLDAAAAAGELAPLRPGLRGARATRDRLAERRFIREIGEWAAPWREVRGVDDARAAAEALGYPLRLKVPIGGYDGRSQARIADADGVEAAVMALGGGAGRARCSWSARSTSRPSCRWSAPATATGRSLTFPASRNVHDAGMLVESVAPGPDPPARGRRRPRDRRLARPRPRPRGAADGRAVPAAGRRADDQRAGAAGAQLAATGRSRAP